MSEGATQLRKGVIELAILALLRRGPRYGKEIVDTLATYPGLEASTGTVYPLLTRLTKTGAVRPEWEESPLGPPRKYYHLTAAGLATFTTQHAAWTTMHTAVATLIGETNA